MTPDRLNPRLRSPLFLIALLLGLVSPLTAKPKPAPETEHWVTVAGEQLPFYTMGSIEHQPRRMEPPTYPQAERDAGVTGVAVILAVVNEKGRPVELHIRSSDPVPSFGEAAKEALAHWRFERFERNGQPTRYLIEVPVVFNLGN